MWEDKVRKKKENAIILVTHRRDGNADIIDWRIFMIQGVAIAILLIIIMVVIVMYLVLVGFIQMMLKALYFTKGLALVITCCTGLVVLLTMGYLVGFGLDCWATVRLSKNKGQTESQSVYS